LWRWACFQSRTIPRRTSSGSEKNVGASTFLR
jgi:hypothetical protein